MKVLVINLGWEQEPLLKELFLREYKVYGVHNNENIQDRALYTDTLICDLRDLEKILAFAEHVQPDAVISDQCDYSYFAQALVAEKFNLPGPRVAAAQIATNKFLQREKSREAGLLIPDYALCRNLGDAELFAEKNGFPIILKPVDNRGSFGVNKVSSLAELRNFYFEALINSHSRLVLAENFIQGNEITVDGYAFSGLGCKSLAIAEKRHVGTTHQVAIDIRYPANLSPELYQKALMVNEKVTSALGYKFGMLHSEYMVTPAGDIYLIEAANRGGGVFTSEVIVPAVSGFPLLQQYVDDATGDQRCTAIFKEAEKNPVILKFFALKPGKIKDITGIDAINKMPAVLRFRLAVEKGAIIPEIKSDAHRHGFFILKGTEGKNPDPDPVYKMLQVQYEQ